MCGLGKTIGHTADVEEVTEHQATDERDGIGHDEPHDKGYKDGEANLLDRGDLAKRGHTDGALLFGGEHAHEGGLDHRDQGHVAVRRDRDRTQQVRCQGLGHENGRGAVRAADDTDGRRLLGAEHARNERYAKCHEHAELCAGTDEECFGVGNEGGEVGHCADADENQARINAELNAKVQEVNKTAVVQDLAEIDIPCRHKELGVEKLRAGQVGQEHTDGNGQQEQGLIAAHDRQVHKDPRDHEHNCRLPPIGVVGKQAVDTRAFKEIQNAFYHSFSP